jgi:plasmid rolling circle replication initiator protein Rep
MHNNNTTHTKTNQDLEILTDKDKNGKERPWREKKLSTLLLAESYQRLGFKKAYRVINCGTYLEYKEALKYKVKKLNKANFCKVRLCPMCGWRRSNKIYGQVSKVMDRALEDKEYRFIFLTLTCKSVEGEELSDTIDNLFHAFKKLSERKVFKQAVKGWFRGLEVTHDVNKFITKDMWYGNTKKHIKPKKDYFQKLGLNIGDKNPSFDIYHPHFHVILMVNKSYFSDPNYYLSQEQWTSLWQDCLNVDYIPIVDVRAFKSNTKKQVSKSVAESAKYTVKDNDYLIPNDLEMTDNAVMILDLALANRRLVAFGGELRKIHKELNLDDVEKGSLIDDGTEETLREDLEYQIKIYGWHVGYKQYVKWGEADG